MSDDVVLHSLSSSDTDQTDHISHYLSNCTSTFPLFLSAPILQNCPPVASVPTSAGEITNIICQTILGDWKICNLNAHHDDHSPHYYWRRLTMKGIFHVRYIIVHGLIWKPRKSEQKVVPGGRRASQYEVSTTCPF